MASPIQSTTKPISVPINRGVAGTTASTGSGTTRKAGGELGKMEFLKLLTAQLSHQDPMDPMDGKQMAADLAQFSGLEQLLNINKALEGQSTQSAQIVQAMNNASALAAVGKSAVIDSDKLVLTPDAQGKMTGKVMADVKTSGVAKLTLLDKSGKEVGSRSLGYVAAGNLKEFDVGTAGDKLKEGAYEFRIDVVDPASGKGVPQQTYTVGKIDGLTYGPDGNAILTMGPLSVAYNAIVKIIG